MTDAKPMMLDDAAVPVAPAPGKDTDGVPYCPEHHCRMKASSSGAKGTKTAYYACVVKGCDETGKRIKGPETVVPNQPQACPRCNKNGDPIYCERDKQASTAAMVILKCPSCGWKSNALAVPQLAAALLAKRGKEQPPVEMIGAR